MAFSKPKLDFRYLRREKTLGKGGFGTVDLVLDVSSGVRYARKIIGCHNFEDLTRVNQEVSSLSKLNHPGVVNLVDAVCGIPLCQVVMEYCPRGNLNERLTRESAFQVELKWMNQLSCAVAYLHENGIIHKDLKPENVLLIGNEGEEDTKIGDFGVAREYDPLPTLGNSQYYVHSAAGTVLYMAPEVFKQRYNEKVDIFSLGIIFYAILQRQCLVLPSGQKIFGCFVNGQGIGQVMYRYPSISCPPFTRRTNQSIINIVLQTLKYDHGQRPSSLHLKTRMEFIYHTVLILTALYLASLCLL